MSAIWEPNRPEIDTSAILVSAPVTSRHWTAAAYLANFLRGKGASLVPTCAPNFYMEDGSTYVFRFWTRTRSSAIQRIWVVGIKPGSHEVQMRAPHTTGTLAEYTLTGDERTTLLYVEDLSTKAIVDGEISLEISVPEGDNFYVETIACYEQDRPILNLDTTDYGVEIESLRASQPIYYGEHKSVGGIYHAMTNADARRCSLFQFSTGGTLAGAGGVTRTSLTYADVLPLGVPILGVKEYRSDTTARAVWRAYCKQAAGTGYLKLTTTQSGVSDEMPVNWSTDAWSLPRVVDVDCDDMAEPDGRQGSGWDDLQVEYAGDGTNAITLKSVSVYTGVEVLDLGSGGSLTSSGGSYFYTSAELSSSFLDFAASNTRRIENRGEGYGDNLLLEAEGNTNNITYSEALDNWTTANGASVTPDSTSSPDAAVQACKVTFTATGTTMATASQIRIPVANDPGGSVDFTISFWAKMDSGTGKVRTALLRRDGTTYSGALPNEFNLTDTWQRFSTSQWAGAAGANPLRLCLVNGSDYAFRDVFIWGVQIETGIGSTPIQNPSSYIRCTGSAATRSPELLTYATGSYPDAFLTRGFALYHIPTESSADMLERNNGSGWTGGTVLGIKDSSNYLRFFNNAGSLYLECQAGSQKVVSSALTFSAGQLLGIEVRPAEGTLRILGATTGNGTYTGTAWSWPAGTLAIGHRASGSTLGANGRFGRYVISL